MLTLIAKKPERVGNGILHGFAESEFTGEQLFLVETDFGNRMRLNSKEFDELFQLKRPQDYVEWRSARLELIEASTVPTSLIRFDGYQYILTTPKSGKFGHVALYFRLAQELKGTKWMVGFYTGYDDEHLVIKPRGSWQQDY